MVLVMMLLSHLYGTFLMSSNNAVRIIQSLIYSFFIIYFLIAIKKFIKEKILIIVFGIVLALSPLLVAWPRYVQTETLAVALLFLPYLSFSFS